MSSPLPHGLITVGEFSLTSGQGLDGPYSAKLDLGTWGALGFVNYVNAPSCIVRTLDGTTTTIAVPDDFYARDFSFEYFADREAGRVLVAGTNGPCVYSLDLPDNRLAVACRLSREYDSYDPGMYRLTFLPTDDCILLVYENGVVCFDWDFAVKWERSHGGRFAWYLKHADGGQVVLESADGPDLAYRLRDGWPVIALISDDNTGS